MTDEQHIPPDPAIASDLNRYLEMKTTPGVPPSVNDISTATVPPRSRRGAMLAGVGAIAVVAAATVIAIGTRGTPPVATPVPAATLAPSATAVIVPTTPSLTPRLGGCARTLSASEGGSFAGHRVIVVTMHITSDTLVSCPVDPILDYPKVTLFSGTTARTEFTQLDGGGQAATATPGAGSGGGQFIIEFSDVSSGSACPEITGLGVSFNDAYSVTPLVVPAPAGLQPCPPEFHVGAMTAGQQ